MSKGEDNMLLRSKRKYPQQQQNHENLIPVLKKRRQLTSCDKELLSKKDLSEIFLSKSQCAESDAGQNVQSTTKKIVLDFSKIFYTRYETKTAEFKDQFIQNLKRHYDVTWYDVIQIASKCVFNLPDDQKLSIRFPSLSERVKERVNIKSCILLCHAGLSKFNFKEQSKLCRLVKNILGMISIAAIENKTEKRSLRLKSVVQQMYAILNTVKSAPESSRQTRVYCELHCLFLIGYLYQNCTGDSQEAEQIFLKAVNLMRKDPQGSHHYIHCKIYFQLAMVYCQLEEKLKAQEFFQKCLESTPQCQSKSQQPSGNQVFESKAMLRANCFLKLAMLEDDLSKREKQLRFGLKEMQSYYKEDAKKYCVNGELLLKLGRVLYHQTRHDEAKCCWESLLPSIDNWLDGSDRERHLYKALCFYNLGVVEKDDVKKEEHCKQGILTMKSESVLKSDDHFYLIDNIANICF